MKFLSKRENLSSLVMQEDRETKKSVSDVARWGILSETVESERTRSQLRKKISKEIEIREKRPGIR